MPDRGGRGGGGSSSRGRGGSSSRSWRNKKPTRGTPRKVAYDSTQLSEPARKPTKFDDDDDDQDPALGSDPPGSLQPQQNQQTDKSNETSQNSVNKNEKEPNQTSTSASTSAKPQPPKMPKKMQQRLEEQKQKSQKQKLQSPQQQQQQQQSVASGSESSKKKDYQKRNNKSDESTRSKGKQPQRKHQQPEPQQSQNQKQRQGTKHKSDDINDNKPTIHDAAIQKEVIIDNSGKEEDEEEEEEEDNIDLSEFISKQLTLKSAFSEQDDSHQRDNKSIRRLGTKGKAGTGSITTNTKRGGKAKDGSRKLTKEEAQKDEEMHVKLEKQKHVMQIKNRLRQRNTSTGGTVSSSTDFQEVDEFLESTDQTNLSSQGSSRLFNEQKDSPNHSIIEQPEFKSKDRTGMEGYLDAILDDPSGTFGRSRHS